MVKTGMQLKSNQRRRSQGVKRRRVASIPPAMLPKAKHFDEGSADQSQFMNIISIVGQGTEDFERVGNSIRVTDVHVNIKASYTETAAGPTVIAGQARFFICYEKIHNNFASVPTTGELWKQSNSTPGTTVTPLLHRNVNRRNQLIILAEKTVDFNKLIGAFGTAIPSASSQTIKLKATKLNIPCTFNAAIPALVDVVEGALYFGWVGSPNTAANWVVAYESRITYFDK